MRVDKVIIEHFKGVKEITTSLKNGVFYICGKNESGKSSFLDGLTFALLGKKAFGIGKWKEITGTSGAKTNTSCVLVDDDGNEMITITRKITKSGNESATIERSDGKQFTQSDLNMILEPIALNPKAFMEMSAREQALFLGIDTAELDAKFKEVYQERQYIGRDVKRLEGAKHESYCEKPDTGNLNINELNQKLHNAGMSNVELNSTLDKIEEKEGLVAEYEQKIISMKKEISELKEKVAGQEIIDLAPIEAEIAKANESSELIQQYKLYEKYTSELKTASAEYEKKSSELEAIKEEKTAKIKATKLPFKNLTTNDSGELVVVKDGKEMPFSSDFFSTGKMWEMSIRILSAKNTELKTIIVKDATLLDEDKIKHISEIAEKNGLQVLMEFVGDAPGDNSITLVEGELK
jgi:predicted ATP-dependent endonuclease of OLD family